MMRAVVSLAPPAANDTIQRTGRAGQVPDGACARAIRGRVGSAAAPPASCRKRLRGSLIASSTRVCTLRRADGAKRTDVDFTKRARPAEGIVAAFDSWRVGRRRWGA